MVELHLEESHQQMLLVTQRVKNNEIDWYYFLTDKKANIVRIRDNHRLNIHTQNKPLQKTTCLKPLMCYHNRVFCVYAQTQYILHVIYSFI